MPDGLVALSHDRQGHSQAAVGLRVSRIKFHGPAIMADGFLPLPAALRVAAQQVMGRGVLAEELRCSSGQPFGLLQFSGPVKYFGEVPQSNPMGSLIKLSLDPASYRFDGFRTPGLRQPHHTPFRQGVDQPKGQQSVAFDREMDMIEKVVGPWNAMVGSILDLSGEIEHRRSPLRRDLPDHLLDRCQGTQRANVFIHSLLESFSCFRMFSKAIKDEPLLILQAGVSIIHRLCLFKGAQRELQLTLVP